MFVCSLVNGVARHPPTRLFYYPATIIIYTPDVR
jgi:hypothetical protein